MPIMIVPLLLAIGLPVAAWIVYRWLKQAHPRHAAKAMAGLGMAALVAAGVWLVLTGKLAGLAAIAAGLGPWLSRALKLHAFWQSVRGSLGAGTAGRRPPPPSPGTGMSVDEAREILGVGADADAAAIKAAHRRLMETNHPDRGGSNWIAARLNQARDRLLS